MSVFGIGAVTHDHNMIVVMARIIGQSAPLIPNMQAALQLSHSFDPDLSSKLVEYDVEDAVDRAREMLKEEFQPLRQTTLINLCSVCEQFVKTVATERCLELDKLDGDDQFNFVFRNN